MTKKIGPSRRWRKQDWNHWEAASKALEYCGEKIIYHTEREAEEKRVRQEAKANIPLRAYECTSSQVQHWHLTSRVY